MAGGGLVGGPSVCFPSIENGYTSQPFVNMSLPPSGVPLFRALLA